MEEVRDMTFLSSDIVHTTELILRLGDRDACRVVQCHHALVRNWVSRFRGELVEIRRDGSLLAFASPEDGLRCAIAIRRNLIPEPDETTLLLSVRMGLGFGPAIRLRRGYFGRTLVVSSRLMERAQAGEILVSRELREQVRKRGGFAFGAHRHFALDDFDEPQAATYLDWHEHDINTEEGNGDRHRPGMRMRSQKALRQR